MWPRCVALYKKSRVEKGKHLLSLAMASLRGALGGVGDDAACLESSAGETLVGLVVANSSTNWSMSARGYFVGPEP